MEEANDSPTSNHRSKKPEGHSWGEAHEDNSKNNASHGLPKALGTDDFSYTNHATVSFEPMGPYHYDTAIHVTTEFDC